MSDEKRPRQIAVYGKGGIGKSTTASTLAAIFGMAGERVLLVACDPKHDTSYRLTDTAPVPTVLGLLESRRAADIKPADFLVNGRHGVTCVEAGGPEPGTGCAGRGLSKMFELFETLDVFDGSYDVVIYDVLGDVVCGGFAVPMRKTYATEVVIVVSGETMALYAANNICRAVCRLAANGVRLTGLIGNLRDGNGETEMIEAFARRLGTRMLHALPRDASILQAELRRLTVVDFAPDSEAAGHFHAIHAALTAPSRPSGVIPRPMSDVGFDEFLREHMSTANELEPVPETPPDGFQPARFEVWLARALSGPHTACTGVAFEADGRLTLELTAGAESVRLSWGPAEGGTGVPAPVGVLVAAQGETGDRWRVAAESVARRLQRIVARYHVPLFDLLSLDEPDEVFELGPGLFSWRIAPFLVAGETRYGPYVYAGETFDGMALRYRFESGRGALLFRLEIGEGATGALLSTRHLSLHLEIDERSAAQREDRMHQVERYLGFLISLSDPPSARYAIRHRTDQIGAGSTQQWGSDLSVQFFADPGYDFLTNFYAAFGLTWPTALLFHGERECSHMGSYSPMPMQAFVEHPLHIRPRRSLAERVFATDLTEGQAVMGGEDRLRAALEEIGNRQEVKTVLVNDTCLVRVIGDDIRRVIEEVQHETRAQLLYLDATAMDETSPFEGISRFWQELIESSADPAPEPRPGSVNLVGYGFADDRPVRELADLLAEAGIGLNAALFPGITWEELLRFRAAGANLVSPYEYVRQSFAGVERAVGLRTEALPLPLGPSGTRAWLAAAAAAAGVTPAELPGQTAAQVERWQGLRARATGRTVGFALVTTQAERLLEAERFLGLPIVDFLAELGFALHVIAYDPDDVQGRRERIAPDELESRLRERLGPSVSLTVEPLQAAAGIQAALRAAKLDLVYSEIRDDPRLRAAGISQLSIVDFELGFEGGLRTAGRLLRRSDSLFDRRFARHAAAAR